MVMLFGDTPFISRNAVIFAISTTGLGLLTSCLLRKGYQWVMVKTKSVFIWVGSIIFGSLIAAAAATQTHMLLWQLVDLFAGGFTPLFESQPSASITFVLFFILLIWSCLYWAISRQSTLYMLEQQNQVMALQAKEAQLNALLDQLSPHFMFNSINNIRAMVLMDANKARDMLMAFADLMRYQLTEQKISAVTLQQEIEFVDDFVALHQLQLGKRLEYKKQIDEQFLAQPIPKMALQLLVENAIKHAFGRQAVTGMLYLEVAKINDKQWHIALSHPGDVLIQDTNSTGLGIENLKARLVMFNEQNISFTLQAANGNVTAKLLFSS